MDRPSGLGKTDAPSLQHPHAQRLHLVVDSNIDWLHSLIDRRVQGATRMKAGRFREFAFAITLVASPCFAEPPNRNSSASSSHTPAPPPSPPSPILTTTDANRYPTPPLPDHKTKDDSKKDVFSKLYVSPLLPKGGDLSALANVDPGLASNLYLYAVGTFSLSNKGEGDPPQTPLNKTPETPQASASPDKFTLTISGSGTTYAINTAETKPSGNNSSDSLKSCTYSGPRSGVPTPHTATEAFSYINGNSSDQCNSEHKMELSKEFISRSDMLCSEFVTNMDISQRTYRSAFSVLGTIFGFVGAVASPAKVFSGLAGVSTGINGNIDAGAFHGEEAYLLANAITSSQEEDRVALYGRLGIPTKLTGAASSVSPTGATSTTTGASTTGSAAVVNITFNPATLGTPGTPAKPGTPPTPASITLSIGGAPAAGITKGANIDSNGSAADLKTASIGTIYSAIDNYHNGCSIRVGLNQLANKLNTGTPVKKSTVPTN